MMLAMSQDRVDGFVIAPPDTTIAAHKLGAMIAFDPAGGKVPELAGFFYIGLAGSAKFAQSDKAEKLAQAFQMTLDAIRDPKTSNAVRDRVHDAQYKNVDPEIWADVWQTVVNGTGDTQDG